MDGASLSERLDRALRDERIRSALDAETFNQPTGEVRSGNAGPMPPVTSPAIVDERDRGASLATIARASLAPNTDDQIRRFAAARFPSLPVDEAVKRYGVDRDGNIIYSDPVTGQLVREVPTIGRGEGIGEKFMRAGSQIASGAGPAIPAVAAGVMGAMTGPTGASILGSGLAAGAADAGRQIVDRYFANEDPSKIDWGNVAGQAALNAGGQAMGVGLNKLLQRNPLGVQQYDRLTARDPAEQQRWADLYGEAQRRGVGLTVGEASNLRSIRSQERALRTLPETTDKFDDFIRTRNTEQVPAAVRAEMDRLAPSRNIGEGANMLRQGADDVLSGMSKARTTAASPHYQAAFQSGVEPDVTPVIQDIEARLAKVGEATPTGRGLRAMLNALTEPQTVLDEATGKEVVQRVPISNYEKLHSIKESFDDIVSGAFDVQQTSAGKRAARDMAGTKAELMDVLKSAHPGYAQGASIYSQMSVPIQEARKGALNALLDKEGPASIRYAEALFDAAKDIPPAEIAKIRQLYTAAGKQDEWMAGVRSFLADRLDTALRINASGEPGGVPGKYVKSVWGTGNQRDILKAAIGDPGLVTSFEKLMDVLQAAARSLPEGSPTAANLAAQQAMTQPGKMARFLGKATSPGTLLSLGDDIVEGLTALRRPGQRIALAEHLMSPQGMEQLRKMVLLSPTSQKAIDIGGLLLAQAGLIGSREGLGYGAPEPRAPVVLDPIRVTP